MESVEPDESVAEQQLEQVEIPPEDMTEEERERGQEPEATADGIDSTPLDELELALEVFQQASFPTWAAKLLAGSFQRRLDATIKAM